MLERGFPKVSFVSKILELGEKGKLNIVNTQTGDNGNFQRKGAAEN